MRRSVATTVARSAAARRGFSSSASSSSEEKIVAAVLFERLPVVIPKIEPIVYAFQEFSGKGEYHIDYEPAPRITEADKTNDKKSLQRALDRRLYLLLYGESYAASDGKPVWHFPEKVYESEDTLRQCAESALKSVIGDLKNTYFVGNAPMGHMVVQPATSGEVSSPFKQFFFKSQVIATNKYDIKKCEDYVWVTKDELLEHFPDRIEYLNKMIIS
uniref:Large ribosomal subunit protein mL46 n=1 Tax=Kalanchoe fedtschenkoi TaxID=63787 RepID=A0A7N0SWH6_KALFE